MTEAELFSAVMCDQDMLLVMRILNSIRLKVKLLMKLEIYNKGEKDITHNWSFGGILRYLRVKKNLERIERIWHH